MIGKVLGRVDLIVQRHFLISKIIHRAGVQYKKNSFTRELKKDYSQLRLSAANEYNQKLKEETSRLNRTLQSTKNEGKTDSDEQKHQMQIDDFIAQYRNNVEEHARIFKQNLRLIEDEEKSNTVRVFLGQNIANQSATIQNTSQQGKMYIPNKLILKKLYLCNAHDSRNMEQQKQILLAGVQPEQNHCLSLSKIIEQLAIKNVVTMIAPDLPYFIKTEGSFLAQWKQFLENPQYARKAKFYINPKPAKLSEICLNSHQLPLVRAGLARSHSFLDTHYYLLQQNEMNRSFEPQPLLSAICAQGVDKVYLGAYPIFEERKMIADSMSVIRLRQLFLEYLRNIRNKKQTFSAQWLFPKEVLQTKILHTIRVARAAAEIGTGRSLIVCPAQMAELIAIEWEYGSKESRLLFSAQEKDYYLGMKQFSGNQDQSFIEHIEKLVILDLIMDPIISKYFVKYRSFPYLCDHTVGGKQNIGKIFIVWMHYYKMYYQELERENGQQNYIRNYDHPKDFI